MVVTSTDSPHRLGGRGNKIFLVLPAVSVVGFSDIHVALGAHGSKVVNADRKLLLSGLGSSS